MGAVAHVCPPTSSPIACNPSLPCPQSANDWVAALQGRPFLGGDQPDLADLAVFGVVRAVTGTDTFNDLMQVRCRCCRCWAAGLAAAGFAAAAAPDRRCS